MYLISPDNTGFAVCPFLHAASRAHTIGATLDVLVCSNHAKNKIVARIVPCLARKLKILVVAGKYRRNGMTPAHAMVFLSQKPSTDHAWSDTIRAGRKRVAERGGGREGYRCARLGCMKDRILVIMSAFLYNIPQVRLDGHFCAVHAVADMIRVSA